MTDEELVGQALMIGVDGSERLAEASASILRTIRPGAVLLFGYNISPELGTVAALTAAIRGAVEVAGGAQATVGAQATEGAQAAGGAGAAAIAVPPLVAIDHEGGQVYRFKGGLTKLPSARAMGRAGLGAARVAGRAAGEELRALGIGMNMAPVAEASTADNLAFLGDRAWSDDPDRAGRLAAAFIRASQAEGTAAVAKHFPGNAEGDPHVGLPVLGVSRAVLEGSYVAPFRRAVQAGVSAVMLSHALVPALDPGRPASLSPSVIAYLKGELGFRGIVITDDLHMAALSGSGGPEGAALEALKAGVDLLMVSSG
jgi:beta-N-acetylhexosaminidase